MPQRADAPSLLRRMLLALLPALLLLSAVGALVDYRQMRELADVAYDQALGNLAVGLAASLESDGDSDAADHLAGVARALSGAGHGNSVLFAVQDARQRLLGGQGGLLALASAAPAGVLQFSDGQLNGRALRVVTLRQVGDRMSALVVVAEGLDVRTAAAGRALRNTVLANMLVVVAVLAVVTVGVGKGLEPLRALGASASSHDTASRETLPVAGVPAEVRPLVDGMNRLIDRLGHTHREQQAFLSASAHQLRTPLAGMQAQLDVAIDGAHGTPALPVLQSLRVALQRLTRVTQQMLALARAEAGTAEPLPAAAGAEVDLVALLQDLVAQYLDTALQRQVDLGLEAMPASTPGHQWMLREMLANLLDNALRYAPAGSQVTLRCSSAPGPDGRLRARVEVEDAGPGIPAAQRERVFDRFVRLSDTDGGGSGLGLSIVRQVAHVHQAAVDIRDGAQGRGTRVQIVFAI